MIKMNIADAALKLGVSKEAIHNRIRRGSLESVIEDDIKYVLIDNTKTSTKTSPRRTQASKTTHLDAKYYQLLETQNEKLQLKVENLENETKTLRDQKEQMLIQEREKIEQIYKDKDEQLKNILNVISSKFLLNAPDDETLIETQEFVEAEIKIEDEKQEDSKKNDSKLISLKKYLKDEKYSKNKREKIKNRFKKVSKKDSRIIVLGKKYYINLVKFDYSDLLK